MHGTKQKPQAAKAGLYVNGYGARVRVTKCADCDCYEGVLETMDGREPLPFVVPKREVDTWRRLS